MSRPMAKQMTTGDALIAPDVAGAHVAEGTGLADVRAYRYLPGWFSSVDQRLVAFRYRGNRHFRTHTQSNARKLTMKTKSVNRLVGTINRLFSEMQDFYDSQEEGCACRSDNRRFLALRKEFNSVLAEIRALGNDVKFDMRGKYIAKFDAKGRERFVVRLRCVRDVFVGVCAGSPKEAVVAATNAVRRGHVPTGTAETSAEVLTR